jgi:hypothetical protein
MQELKHNDALKQYQNELVELQKQVKTELTPVRVSVTEDVDSGIIVLTIGKTTLHLASNQARDLAAELRKAANKVGAQRFEKDRKRKRRR